MKKVLPGQVYMIKETSTVWPRLFLVTYYNGVIARVNQFRRTSHSVDYETDVLLTPNPSWIEVDPSEWALAIMRGTWEIST